jgi:hypothetical protein
MTNPLNYKSIGLQIRGIANPLDYKSIALQILCVTNPLDYKCIKSIRFQLFTDLLYSNGLEIHYIQMDCRSSRYKWIANPLDPRNPA